MIKLDVPRENWVNHLPIYVERVVHGDKPCGWYLRIRTRGWVWTRDPRTLSHV